MSGAFIKVTKMNFTLTIFDCWLSVNNISGFIRLLLFKIDCFCFSLSIQDKVTD
jgi:hypothetical protein